MHDKFTERVRKVIYLAREEAARLQHDYIGTEHLRLGVIREGEGIAERRRRLESDAGGSSDRLGASPVARSRNDDDLQPRIDSQGMPDDRDESVVGPAAKGAADRDVVTSLTHGVCLT